MGIDKGDTAWVLMCSALVLLMTAPGLALFYGGMVRQKNALATLMQSFVVLCLVSIQWVLFGYRAACWAGWSTPACAEWVRRRTPPTRRPSRTRRSCSSR